MTPAEPPAPRRSRIPWLWLALMLAGPFHWALVFGVPPRVPRDAADWPKEMRYYAVLQEAVREGVVPYTVSRPIQETRKLLALPEVVLSPQIVLLRWMEVDGFVFAHVVLLQTAATIGCWWLARRLGLSTATSVLLWLLLSFNGHVVAHLAIGHSMWGGYFLLPVFFLCCLDLAEDRNGPRWSIGVALLLAAMLLQGSFHVFVWSLFLLLLQGAFGAPWRPIAAALAWTAALGLVRLAPAALILAPRRAAPFETGYPLGELWAAFTEIRDVRYPRLGSGAMGGLHWWEFDLYIGAAALVWLLWFGIRGLAARPRPWRLAGPILVLVLLSLDSFYAPLNASGLPFLGSQRVSSRFLVVPFGLLVIAAAQASETWRRAAGARGTRLLWLLALVTAAGLVAHSRAWSTARLESQWPPPPRERDLAIEIVSPNAADPRDVLYVAIVQASALASAGALVLALRRLRSRSTP